MIDDLPGEITVPTRDAERDRFLRDYSFHAPGDQTGPGTEPYILASTIADMVMPLYRQIKTIADATDPSKITGKELLLRAQADGVLRLHAVGASGAVQIGAAVGGGTIFAGDVIIANGLQYQCTTTALYLDGAQVPVSGVDTGIATNQAAGTVMSWNPPRPGIVTNATVVAQVNGSGLFGGRDEETYDELRDRWNREKASRAASGNDAEIQEAAENTPGIAIDKAFTYPCTLGPCTTMVAFTLRPATSGASRIPNSTQRDAVLANVVSQMPKDEGIMMATIIAEPVDVAVQITWDETAFTWADLSPWPQFYGGATQAIVVQTGTDATHFALKSFDNDYTALPSPVAGQTIAFYEIATATFWRKRILSVAGTGPWTIVADTTGGASDVTYTPAIGQRAMPWSDSLQTLVEPATDYFATLGPGEQQSSFFDPGVRQRRQPPSPKHYPSILSTKGLEGAFDDVDSVFDLEVAEPTLPRATATGTPGTVARLIQLNYLSAFPI